MESREWDYDTGLARAQSYCAGAEHCSSEVAAMLERHGLSRDKISGILESLAKDGFTDESRYARAFVSDKIRFARWGRRKIGPALKMKHIDGAIVSQALEDIDMQVYMEVLEKVVRACYRQVKAPAGYARNMKTLKSAVSRGFEPELVRRFLPNADGEELPEIFDNTL